MLSDVALTGFAHLLRWLLVAEHELLLFATFWFIVSAIDEAAIDFSWIWLRLGGHAGAARVPLALAESPLLGRAAILVPAWHENEVIGHMITHTLKAWAQRDFVVYVGCYRNDPATLTAASAAAGGDPRIRVVVNAVDGPTTKADCLNRLYGALRADEARSGVMYRNIIMHDAEDMVHPAALAVMDRALAEVDFVQLPVRPEPQPASLWVAGHYSDEFTEAHAKSLVVRDALGAAIPAAGVGCGFSREALASLARLRMASGGTGPFASECLTEDYELGLLIARDGGRSRFLRMRDEHGNLVATRSYFPSTLETAVRQKARWIHGIALQSWERLGWSGRPIEIWMALRDRRGPLTAVVLAAAYLLLMVEAVLAVARLAGWQDWLAPSPALRFMIAMSSVSFVWRAGMRFAFTAREYGVIEGLLAVMRIPVANIISIMAGRRALVAYVRTLSGGEVSWDKTRHGSSHPSLVDDKAQLTQAAGT
ncbi:MAG: glycosyl transferase family protein [Novosphingobium sp.]